MSFVSHLYHTKTKMELAELLVATAKENAVLKDKVSELEHRIFWTQVKQEKETK